MFQLIIITKHVNGGFWSLICLFGPGLDAVRVVEPHVRCKFDHVHTGEQKLTETMGLLA